MTNKENVKGFVIPTECGTAETYEVIAIMYHCEEDLVPEKEYSIFITREDYNDKKEYTKIVANMNPTLLLLPNEDNAGTGVFEYDLIESDSIHTFRDGACAIIISEVVDTKWITTEVERETYLSISPKAIYDNCNVITMEK